jgi:hypothetical protein
MWPYRPISDWERRRGGRGKERDIAYLKESPDSQFLQEIRQCLGMILSWTLKMIKMNGHITTYPLHS